MLITKEGARQALLRRGACFGENALLGTSIGSQGELAHEISLCRGQVKYKLEYILVHEQYRLTGGAPALST